MTHSQHGFRVHGVGENLHHAGAKYNLANSGVKSYPLSSLPVDFQSLQLTGPGAYGYRPLVEASPVNPA